MRCRQLRPRNRIQALGRELLIPHFERLRLHNLPKNQHGTDYATHETTIRGLHRLKQRRPYFSTRTHSQHQSILIKGRNKT